LRSGIINLYARFLFVGDALGFLGIFERGNP
jgi:hypothetical protein